MKPLNLDHSVSSKPKLYIKLFYFVLFYLRQGLTDCVEYVSLLHRTQPGQAGDLTKEGRASEAVRLEDRAVPRVPLFVCLLLS